MSKIKPDLESLTEAITKRAAKAPKLGGAVLLELTDLDACIYIDGSSRPPEISHTDGGRAKVTLKLKAKTLVGVLEGTTDPTMAAMTGKIKIRGSIGAANKLVALLDEGGDL